MKLMLICAVILSATTAAAETVIVEYHDHYYVESTGIPGAKPAPSQERLAPVAYAAPIVEQAGNPRPATASPVVSPEYSPKPLTPAERRAQMEGEIERLQRERGELLAQREGETPEQTEQREREAAGRLRKINRLSSEMLKIPSQGSE